MEPAGKEEVIRLQTSLLDPRLQGIPGGRRDLKLDRALGLVLPGLPTGTEGQLPGASSNWQFRQEPP